MNRILRWFGLVPRWSFADPVFAEAFVRCGGVVTAAEAKRLSVAELVGLMEAADRVAAARTVALAEAIRSRHGAAAALAPFDGGRAGLFLRALELGATVAPEEVTRG